MKIILNSPAAFSIVALFVCFDTLTKQIRASLPCFQNTHLVGLILASD
jgi:hypothetical protein